MWQIRIAPRSKTFDVLSVIQCQADDTCYEIRIKGIVPQDGFCALTSCIADKIGPWCVHH